MHLPSAAPHTFSRAPAGSLPIRSLTIEDAPAMVALTDVAFPGFFRSDTYRLGRYFGLHREGELIAMAGERIALPGFGRAKCRLHPPRPHRPRIRRSADRAPDRYSSRERRRQLPPCAPGKSPRRQSLRAPGIRQNPSDHLQQNPAPGGLVPPSPQPSRAEACTSQPESRAHHGDTCIHHLQRLFLRLLVACPPRKSSHHHFHLPLQVTAESDEPIKVGGDPIQRSPSIRHRRLSACQSHHSNR